MLDLSTAKKLLVLERLVIGVEEPILIKGAGEFSAKIDSGNSGYNVIHGEDLYVNGDILVFATFNAEGEIRRISKKIQSYLDVNIGGGHIESRPVVLLDIKFADEDYKSVPFSVTNRSAQKNKVLICKDFISKELDALIDPGAENISSKGVEVELTTEKSKTGFEKAYDLTKRVVKAPFGAITRLGNAAANFKQGQGGAMTSYLGGEYNNVEGWVKDAKNAIFDKNKEKEDKDKKKGSKESEEYAKFKRNEKNKEQVRTQVDPVGARNTAQAENIAKVSGIPGATPQNSSIFGILDYDGYLAGNKEVVSSQKNFKELAIQFLARREAARNKEQLKTEAVEPEVQQPEQQAPQEDMPLSQEDKRNALLDLEYQEKIGSPYAARNFFRFNLMTFFPENADEQTKTAAEAEFSNFMTKHQSQLEAYANQFFQSLGSGFFSPDNAAAVSFINNVKMLMENDSDINGVFFVATGDADDRRYNFYKRKNLVITPEAQNRAATIRKHITTYNQLKTAWVNDDYLKNLPITIPSLPSKNWIKVINQDPSAALSQLRKAAELPPLYKYVDDESFTPESEKILKNLINFFSEFRVKDQQKLPEDKREIFDEVKKRITNYTPPQTDMEKVEKIKDEYEILKAKWEKDPVLTRIDLEFDSESSIESYKKFLEGLNTKGNDFLVSTLKLLNVYKPNEYFTEGQIHKTATLVQQLITLWEDGYNKLPSDERRFLKQNYGWPEPYKPNKK